MPNVWLADWYAPQAIDLGGGGSSSYQCDTVGLKGLSQKNLLSTVDGKHTIQMVHTQLVLYTNIYYNII